MSSVNETSAAKCAVYVDMGTTNTRVWLALNDEVIAETKAQEGVRDAARQGSSALLRTALRDLIVEVRAKAASGEKTCEPSLVAAAGMITSEHGLMEIPHVAAPAGALELSASAKLHSFPDVVDLPVLLVPGVRCGKLVAEPETVGTIDVIRGEETLCVGLVGRGLLRAGATLLNLGSHWKAIRLDEHARISSSFTTLSGEMIYVAQTQTVLASAVPHERPISIDQRWSVAGMLEQRRSDLTRALFCVRLLEQRGDGTPEQRLSFLIGAFISADLDAMLAHSMLAPPVVITGGGVIAEAWKHALAAKSISAVVVEEAEIERSFVVGLRRLAFYTESV